MKNIAGTAPRAGTASEGIMVVSDEEVAALKAKIGERKEGLGENSEGKVGGLILRRARWW